MDRIARDYSAAADPVKAASEIQMRLFSYADEIDAWAHEISGIMLKRAGAADFETWKLVGGELSAETRKRLKDALTGKAYEDLQNLQVDLIKSLPREAAEKVQEMAQRSLMTGERFASFAEDIKRLGPITMSRAICIARTETARARTSYTEARAQAVGSTHYIWHTVGDGAVRPRHRQLDGTIQSWSDPPITSEPGQKIVHSHPGQLWNCRCWAEPLFPKSKYES